MSRLLVLALFCTLLYACGTAAPAPTPISTILPPTSTSVPASLPAPTATMTQIATALPMPTAIQEPVQEPTAEAEIAIRALYLCTPGFCRLDPGVEEPVELLTALDVGIYGYVFSSDGKTIIYAIDGYADEDSHVQISNLDLLETQGVLDIRGIPSGAGGLEGYGVIGVTADGERVIYEDQAQLFIANLDGSERRALMGRRPYGASSTHRYSLSPSGLRVLYTTSNIPNAFELLDVETQQSYQSTLSSNRRPIALVDDNHLLVEVFDPPFDWEDGNPAGISRFTLGYEITPILGETLGEPVLLREDDGSTAHIAVSNVAGGLVLLREDGTRDGGEPEPEQLWLLNLTTGTHQPFLLPGYNGYSSVAISIVE